MFYNLAKSISTSILNISSSGRITRSNIKRTLHEIRNSLLDADVSLSVVKQFISDVKKDSIGKTFNNSLTPGQEFIKIVREKLIKVMGKTDKHEHILNMSVEPPAVFLVFGAQGMGKTTTIGKLANFIRARNKKKILVTSTDIYRPAAKKQLNILSNQALVDFFYSKEKEYSVKIAEEALEHAKRNVYDILIIDTPGVTYTDVTIMNIVQDINNKINPIESLLVVDAMMGQDAINMITEFDSYVPISGVILTKVDSDARGGIALSVRYGTGKPIKFIGTGEKMHEIEYFESDKIADRILGMESAISVIQEIEKKVEVLNVKKIKNTFSKKNKFNLCDFLTQIQQMNKIGGIGNILNRFLKNQSKSSEIHASINDKLLTKFSSIINSMTKKEKLYPEILKSSRKRRIALGSGSTVQDINQMLKQFENVKKIVKLVKKNGMSNAIKNIGNYFPNKFF